MPTRRPYAARLPMEERRTQLLDATLRIIVRDGYDKVSIDAIAKEAGVTRPVVYGAYDGLRPLLFALLDRTQARALTQLADVMSDDVATSVGRFLHVMREDPDTWRPILFTEGTPEAVRARIEGDRDIVRAYVASLLDVPDPEATAHLVVAAAEHACRLLLTDPAYDADRLVAALGGLLNRQFAR